MMQFKYRGNTRILEVKIVDDGPNKGTGGSAPLSQHDYLEISTIVTNVLVSAYENAMILKLN